MADQTALLTEAYSRGLLPPDRAAAYEEAVKRGVISDPTAAAAVDAKARSANTPGIVRSISNGFTLNHSGELDAASAALETGAHNLITRATGGTPKYGMADAYHAVMGTEDNAETQFAKNNPVQNVTGQVVGAVANPLLKAGAGYVGRAGSLTSAALRSAAVGSAAGAVAGEGDARGGLQSRLIGGAEGAATGAALGAAVPVVAKPVGALVSRIGGAMNEAGSRVMQGFGADAPKPTPTQIAAAGDKAGDYVGKLVKAAPSNALTSNTLEAAGKPVTAAEALGRPGVTQLASVARRSGTTPDALEAQLTERAAAMPERVLDNLQKTTGVDPAAIQGDFAAHAANLRTKAAPLYEAAYSEPAPQGDKLNALMARPSMKSAMGRAVNIAAEEGRSPQSVGFVVSPSSGDVPEMVSVKSPTMQTMDYIKRGLDDVLETYRDKTTGKLQLDTQGRAVLGTLNDLRGELTNPTTDAGKAYGAALNAGGEPLRLEEAYRAAKPMTGAAVSESAFKSRFDGFTDAQKEAFKGGYLNKVYEDLRAGRMRLKDTQAPAFATKAKAILGDEAGASFLTDIQQELQLSKMGARMNPGAGSPTMELGAADAEREAAFRGLRGAAGTLSRGKPLAAAIQALSSPVVGAYRGASAPIDEATRNEVGRLLSLKPIALHSELSSRAAKGPPKADYRAIGAVVPRAAQLLSSRYQPNAE